MQTHTREDERCCLKHGVKRFQVKRKEAGTRTLTFNHACHSIKQCNLSQITTVVCKIFNHCCLLKNCHTCRTHVVASRCCVWVDIRFHKQEKTSQVRHNRLGVPPQQLFINLLTKMRPEEKFRCVVCYDQTLTKINRHCSNQLWLTAWKCHVASTKIKLSIKVLDLLACHSSRFMKINVWLHILKEFTVSDTMQMWGHAISQE